MSNYENGILQYLAVSNYPQIISEQIEIKCIWALIWDKMRYYFPHLVF
jgi:hypothetical protein